MCTIVSKYVSDLYSAKVSEENQGAALGMDAQYIFLCHVSLFIVFCVFIVFYILLLFSPGLEKT